jgi:hypothetical protein
MISIESIKKINEFSFSSSSLEIGKSQVGEEVKFPPRTPQQIINIRDLNENIIFVLTYYGEETKHFRFKEGLFFKDELNKLAKTFNFRTIPHPHASDVLVGSLQIKNEAYKGQCFGAISKNKNDYYLLIFARRGTTGFEEDIIYVHDIWKVELSEMFKNKLFSNSRS